MTSSAPTLDLSTSLSLGTISDSQLMETSSIAGNNGFLSSLLGQRPGSSSTSDTSDIGSQQSPSSKVKNLAEIIILLFSLLFGSQGSGNNLASGQGGNFFSNPTSELSQSPEQSSPMDKLKKLLELILQLAFGNQNSSQSEGGEMLAMY